MFQVWSLLEMKCINALYGHDNTVCELAVTDKYLFSGSYNIINVKHLSRSYDIDPGVGYRYLELTTNHNIDWT